MADDDRRMHGDNTPGLVKGRGHERHEDPVRLNHPEPGEDKPLGAGEHAPPRGDSMRDRHQPSALGGEVATRSNTTRTPEEDRDE